MREMTIHCHQIVYIKGTNIKGEVLGGNFDEETLWVSFEGAEPVLMRLEDVSTEDKSK